MQREILRKRLAERTGPVDDAWLQLVDANTPVHAEALEL